MKETGEGERQVEATGGGVVVGQADTKGYCGGKLLSPQRLPARAVEHACEQYEVSEQRACRVVRQWRGTQRYLLLRRTDEDQADTGDPGPGGEVWAVRLSAHHGVVAGCGVAGGQGSSAADLATRRAEGAAQRPRGRLYKRWFVYSVADGAGESCVELRFREGDDERWIERSAFVVVRDKYTRECLPLRWRGAWDHHIPGRSKLWADDVGAQGYRMSYSSSVSWAGVPLPRSCGSGWGK